MAEKKKRGFVISKGKNIYIYIYMHMNTLVRVNVKSAGKKKEQMLRKEKNGFVYMCKKRDF